MNGTGLSYGSETVWNVGNGIGSSGGISPQYPIPAWQQGVNMSANGGSTTMRNMPDVAMVADALFTFANNGTMGYTYGTSCAAPLWAGFTALVNQAALANGQPEVGFLNPALYAVGKSSAYAASFHDVTTGNNTNYLNPTRFRAVTGYDLCTGWGSPKGSNLIYSLAMPEPLVIAPLAEVIFTGPAGGPFSSPTPAYTLTNKAASSVSWSLATDATWLDLAPAAGALAAAGPGTNVTAQPNGLASSLGAGTYNATVFFTNLSDQVVQSRQIVLAVFAPPLITSQPTNQAVLAGMSATFTVGTETNALLSYQWQLNNGLTLTNLSDGGNISGSASSALTISNVSSADLGAYSVIVSNAAGSVSSTNASLSLVSSLPVILAQPGNRTVLPGTTTAFTVVAAGDQPLSYAWFKNGVNLADGGGISGSASSTLTIASPTPADAGTYTAVITNTLGSLATTGAVLAVTIVTSPGVALETVYSFDANGTIGFNPYAGLVQASDGKFYGTASQGGLTKQGTIFRVDTNGIASLVHSFSNGSEGAFPYAGLVQGTNGLLYGMTRAGGTNNGEGTAFRISTGGTITSYSLNPPVTGGFPYGGLIQGTDGNFYGLTSLGGSSGYTSVFGSGNGTVVRLTAAGVLSALCSFNYEDGANPSSTLVQGRDGNFYGTAQGGGTNGGWGSVFKTTPAGTLTALFSFGNTNGATPFAGLAQDDDGTLYGTTYAGGAHNAGTVFKVSPDGAFSSLYSFGGGDGSNCHGGLLLASDGNFYGTTENGGAYNAGTVFRLSPSGTLITVAQFDSYQGANPEGTLVQGTDGKLYGTTYNGGAHGKGAVFRLSMDAPLQITRQPQDVAAFAGDAVAFSVATFGSLPVSYQWLKNGTNLTDTGIISGSNARTLTLTNISVADAANYSVVVSNVYGPVTSLGARLAVIFSPPYVIAGPEAQLALVGSTVTFSVEAGGDGPLSFQWQEYGTNLADGGNISGSATSTLKLASVTAASAGTYSVIVSNALYGTSSTGAVLTVIPVNAPGTAVVSLRPFSFDNYVGAYNPYAGVVQGRDGFLYGTTMFGGQNGYGTVFKVATSGGGFTILRSFGYFDLLGNVPLAGLVQGADGNFYVATFSGGTGGAGASFGAGTLFKTTSAGAATLLHTFSAGGDGGQPAAALVQGRDGKFYGTTEYGGLSNTDVSALPGYGTVFVVDTNGKLISLHVFTGAADGGSPAGSLLEAINGKFYGTTTLGGSNGFGTLFNISTNGALSSLVSFDYIRGAYPSNALVQASDGAFYGAASSGGTNGGWGTVFRMSADGTLTSLHSFNYQDGATPTGGLVEGTDGNLYGTTSQGGVGGQGTVFQITKAGQLTTVLWFNGSNGANPQSTLIQARDGSFYGTTEFGGTDYNGTAGTGDGVLFRLTLPMFLLNPFAQATATTTARYSASLATNAVTPAGDTLTFTKVSGPAWLSVAADGTLSGTPAVADLGANVFTVSLADTNGWSSTATLTITVVPAPLLASLSLSQGTNLVLNWSGGQPPYSVQVATDLASAAWQTIAGPMTNTTLLVAPTNAAAFYRVRVGN